MANRVHLPEGSIYGRLTVIREVDGVTFSSSKQVHRRFQCRCDCGSIVNVMMVSLRSGRTTSCGCYNSEQASVNRTTHGMSRTGSPEYLAWLNMKRRCLKPNHPSYKNYGGRGITVYPQWITNFQAFYDHLGPRPSSDYTLDRTDNDGNYEPGNVRWATWEEQGQNRRRSGPLMGSHHRVKRVTKGRQ